MKMLSYQLTLHALLVLALILRSSTAQWSKYHHNLYSSIAPSLETHIRPSSRSFVPLNFHEDLQLDESKGRDITKKQGKKAAYKNYASEEDNFSNEHHTSSEYSSESQIYNSLENNNHEYTIGTQIHVQHPITAAKKTIIKNPNHGKYVETGPYKSRSSNSYGDLNISTEESLPEVPKHLHAQKFSQHFEVDPFHVIPPPKVIAANDNNYNVYEPEHKEYSLLTSSRANGFGRYKGVASKKQIDAYVEDQTKELEDAVKLRVFNDPNIQKYLKTKIKESLELELDDLEIYPPNLMPPFRNNFDENLSIRKRRRPTELKRAPKTNHIMKPKRNYRSAALLINV